MDFGPDFPFAKNVSYACKGKAMEVALDELFKKYGDLGYIIVSKEGDKHDGWVLLTTAGERGAKKPEMKLTEAEETDAAVLAPGSAMGSAACDAFLREVVREMTVKAGQKCTAIRRIFVPADQAGAIADALAAKLKTTKVGDPRQEEASHRIAWAAVKRIYLKIGDSWVAR